MVTPHHPNCPTSLMRTVSYCSLTLPPTFSPRGSTRRGRGWIVLRSPFSFFIHPLRFARPPVSGGQSVTNGNVITQLSPPETGASTPQGGGGGLYSALSSPFSVFTRLIVDLCFVSPALAYSQFLLPRSLGVDSFPFFFLLIPIPPPCRGGVDKIAHRSKSLPDSNLEKPGLCRLLHLNIPPCYLRSQGRRKCRPEDRTERTGNSRLGPREGRRPSSGGHFSACWLGIMGRGELQYSGSCSFTTHILRCNLQIKKKKTIFARKCSPLYTLYINILFT